MNIVAQLLTYFLAATVVTGAGFVCLLTYLSSGAPAYWATFARTACERLVALNGGSVVSRRRVFVAELRKSFSLNPIDWFTDDDLTWAHRFRASTAKLPQESERRMDYAALGILLGGGETSVAGNLWSRDQTFVADQSVVMVGDASTVKAIRGLSRHARLRQGALALAAFRGAPQRPVLLPLALRLLDYLGRGASVGLIAASVISIRDNGVSTDEFVDHAALLTIVGAAAASVAFVTRILRETSPVFARDQPNKVWAFIFTHHLVAALLVPTLACLLPLAAWVAGLTG